MLPTHSPMPKKEDQSPKQIGFNFSVPAASLADVSGTEATPTSDLPLILDPEATLAELHYAMNKRPTPPCDLIDEDIRHQVDEEMKKLYQIWRVPSNAERRAALEESFDETIRFLQALPFHDTNAMAYIESHELTYNDIQELRAALSGQFDTFADKDSSVGFRRHGTVAAFIRDQATDPKTPKRFLKK